LTAWPGDPAGEPDAGGFFAVVHRQRACRAFLPDPVPDADIERMLGAATCAPSAENTQPWTFVVVREAGLRAAIAELAERSWRSGAAAHERDRLEPRLFADVEAGAVGGFATAPLVVVAAGDTSAVSRPALAASLLPAIQNLLLAAIALGYGSALTTLALIHEDELRSLIGLPDSLRPFAVVPIGRPARRLGPPRRRPVGEVAHRDRWGAGWSGG
jgi:nitroreductase